MNASLILSLVGLRYKCCGPKRARGTGGSPGSSSLGLFDALYAHEFLFFQARMFGLDEETARRRVSELLDAMELGGTGKKRLLEFSAGMRKRLALAAAVIHGPDLLFLDEPFESIDPAGVASIKQWLHKITAQGRTVFLTTHVLETVERLCSQVAIITKPGQTGVAGRH